MKNHNNHNNDNFRYAIYALLFISGFIFALSLGQAFSKPHDNDNDRVLTTDQTMPKYHRTFEPDPYDEQEAERLARIEWIKRNGDIPPAPSQADLDYMQGYAQQLQAQYDKEGE